MQAFSFTSKKIARRTSRRAPPRRARSRSWPTARRRSSSRPAWSPALRGTACRCGSTANFVAAHNKVLIVDADAAAATLVTGSYNFTSAAQFRNAENVLIIRNYPALAAQYRANLLKLREKAQRYDGAQPVRRAAGRRDCARSKVNSRHARTDRLRPHRDRARRRGWAGSSSASSPCASPSRGSSTAACAARARRGRRRAAAPRCTASFARVVFPLTALRAPGRSRRFVYRRYVGAPFFLAIAIPLLIALAAIRMIVYGMRRLFHAERGCRRPSARSRSRSGASSSSISSACCPRSPTRSTRCVMPVGKTQISLLTIGNGVARRRVHADRHAVAVGPASSSGSLRATHLDTNAARGAGQVRAARCCWSSAVLIALQAIGFDLTLLSVFGGALGVGIGLGLQKLASNYIAGFTILLDRSIRLGDMITVDNRHGRVSKVTSRYVVVRSLDGVEAIVPNETLVTTTVLNHSYTTRDIRIGVPFRSPTTATSSARSRSWKRPRARHAARAAGAQRRRSRIRELRRERHRPRARLLDRRSGERPGQRAQRDQPRDSRRRSRRTASACPYPQRDIRIVDLPSGPARPRPAMEPLRRDAADPAERADSPARRLARVRATAICRSGRLRV